MEKFCKIGAELALMAMAGVALGGLGYMEVAARKRGSSLKEMLDNSMDVMVLSVKMMPAMVNEMKDVDMSAF